ncbi:hypothetical protein [Candidatus Phycosocius spiralis]|uniref:Uncharacterized protein n=1 Tax=Candidatus Phycosocius spiralis TaxID=2815099 RepID=A0ABQ4PVV8_9PROT|nr:hypothetical protein [Candidatus Phycosocius spiralis]GIU67133.1 hypothetical protein PsB1_1287 [Candidatus Phycosocius spiralis]
MTILAYPQSRRNSKAPKVPSPVLVAPPTGALLNVILSYADLCEDIGGGLSLLRVSARRMADVVIVQTLGREVSRLREVSIIWNDESSEIHTILDAASPPGIEEGWYEPQFELTDFALAYLAKEMALDSQVKAS